MEDSGICIRGIKTRNFNLTNITTIDSAIAEFDYRDLHFYGSFCPPVTGVYRFVFNGTLNQINEESDSKYTFNGVSSGRESPYHVLDSHTCYPYHFTQSIQYSHYNIGKLFYQMDNGPLTLVTLNVSFNCERLLCLRGSTHPQCIKTDNHQTCISQMYVSILFLTFLQSL